MSGTTPKVLDGPHLPRAPHARLNFVNYQHDAVLVAYAAELREEIRVRHDVAAFSLDRLDDYGGAVLWRQCGFKDSLFDIASDAASHAFI